MSKAQLRGAAAVALVIIGITAFQRHVMQVPVVGAYLPK